MYIFLDENRLNVNAMVAGYFPIGGNDNIYLHFLTLVNKILHSSRFSKILTSISSHIRKEINTKWLLTLVARIIRYVGTLLYFLVVPSRLSGSADRYSIWHMDCFWQENGRRLFILIEKVGCIPVGKPFIHLFKFDTAVT